VKLAYPIPHRVTIRMVGCMLVASCTCKTWAAQADPRRYDKMPGAWYPNGLLPSPTEELIAKAHEHATDHVLEQQRLARKAAA
jgi:hypothetical protein